MIRFYAEKYDGREGESGSGTGTGTGTPEKVEARMLAPQYPEDFYPGMPKTDGVLAGIPIDEKRNLRFAMHGYFRAPMRITKVPRAEGSTKPNEGSSNYRTPFLIDDDYFRSGFAYTPVNETDFTELSDIDLLVEYEPQHSPPTLASSFSNQLHARGGACT